MGRRRRGARGHYCWSCGGTRPNEAFSGRGHTRHVCRDCARLGHEELQLRQAQRDMERAVGFDGLIPRRRRPTVERFLTHENPRVREHAASLLEADRLERQEWRRIREEEEARAEAMFAWSEPGREELADRASPRFDGPSTAWDSLPF